MAGRMMAARIAMMATTQTTSRRVKPRCAVRRSLRPADDIGRRARATFLPVRAVGDDVIRSVLARRAIEIGVSPRILGDRAALQIRPVPRAQPARALRERVEA